uniref:Uncharacterized protein n=1 Tax=Chromera velia CCMP2878 TaxID=1169474 RepID=A0A0G4FTT2_9ALVE|eukprot:Cvel_3713.t1-p1 / transcript=Cvel_3713.t1 / gene=Cvel_3713 / organism=Chromera_velia_CCMP2878 / gene_product=hypothetical protein / transcript_product=hypothetical protein / location=Cvel_scaffold154:90191-90436(-) / protein_length=82 / sequence_SO=supercontig / SO=protein_coding / is_pseudo=false
MKGASSSSEICFIPSFTSSSTEKAGETEEIFDTTKLTSRLSVPSSAKVATTRFCKTARRSADILLDLALDARAPHAGSRGDC